MVIGYCTNASYVIVIWDHSGIDDPHSYTILFTEREYDHLNYTPPANKWKHNYQRMTNGFPAAASPASITSPASTAPPIPPLPKPPSSAVSSTPPPPPERDLTPLQPNMEENDPPAGWCVPDYRSSRISKTLDFSHHTFSLYLFTSDCSALRRVGL